ncbi:hypothetical protein [Akkermansia sp.]|uniref:hypothetical protein n=1 Tax=Akkermansia sp. TaxID=1872421 RepID=UPI003AB597AE
MTAISISRIPTVYFFEVRGGKIGLRGECFFNENVKELEDFFHEKGEKTGGEIMLVSWVNMEVIRFDKTAVVRRVDVFEMRDVGIIAGKPVRLCAWWWVLLSGGNRGDVSVVFMERFLFPGCFSKCLYSVEWVDRKRGGMRLSHFFRFNTVVGETGMEFAGRLEKFCMIRVQQNRDEKGNNCATDVMKSTVFCVKCVTGNVAEMAQHLPQRKPQPEGELEFNSNKGGGGEIPRCMRGSPFRVDFFSSPPPIFSERVKAAWGGLLPEFVVRGNGMVYGLDRGVLSRRTLPVVVESFPGPQVSAGKAGRNGAAHAGTAVRVLDDRTGERGGWHVGVSGTEDVEGSVCGKGFSCYTLRSGFHRRAVAMGDFGQECRESVFHSGCSRRGGFVQVLMDGRGR